MRSLLLTALAALAFAGPARAKGPEPFQIISVEEASKLVGRPGVLFFDANTRQTFDQGRVPGATFVGHLADASPLPKQRKDATLIFYCRNPK